MGGSSGGEEFKVGLVLRDRTLNNRRFHHSNGVATHGEVKRGLGGEATGGRGYVGDVGWSVVGQRKEMGTRIKGDVTRARGIAQKKMVGNWPGAKETTIRIPTEQRERQ